MEDERYSYYLEATAIQLVKDGYPIDDELREKLIAHGIDPDFIEENFGYGL